MQIPTVFEANAKLLEGSLSRATVISEDEIRSSISFQHKLEGIKSTPEKRRGRTDEAIEADCVTGQAAENGIAKLLRTEVFDSEFDLKDRSTFAKDVIYDGLKIEVKSHKHLRKFSVPHHSVEMMMKSLRSKEFDLLVFAHVERAPALEGYFVVTPTLIVDPYPKIIDFSALWDIEEFSRVYRADLAYKRNLCHPLIDLEA